MQITWYGQSCFKIVSGQTSIIIDPFDKALGITPPRGKVDILLISDSSLSDYSQIDAGFVVSGAGEYEIGGIHINGVSSFKKDEKGDPKKQTTMYVVVVEGVRICHLSDFDYNQVTEVLDKMGQVDILMVPIGGKYKIGSAEFDSLDSERAVNVVSEIDPRVVVPMNFKVPKLKLDIDGSDKFMKAMGVADVSAVEKITLKKRDLPQEGRDVVLMKLP